jgi:hypothetical protein
MKRIAVPERSPEAREKTDIKQAVSLIGNPGQHDHHHNPKLPT